MRPAVADPVCRDQARHRLLVAFGQGVLGEAVQAVVDGRNRGQQAVHEGHHLGRGHAVVGDLQGEERGVAHRARDLVAQALQLDQAGLELAPDLLRRRPSPFAFLEVARLAKQVVDVVGRGRPHAGAGSIGLQTEGVAVENRGLAGLGLDALDDNVGDGGRVVGGGEQQLVELADRQGIEVVFLLEQRPRLLDHQLRARDRGQGLFRGGAGSRVLGGHVGRGCPGGLVGHGVQRLYEAAHGFEKGACRALLLGCLPARAGVKSESRKQGGSQRNGREHGGVAA